MGVIELHERGGHLYGHFVIFEKLFHLTLRRTIYLLLDEVGWSFKKCFHGNRQLYVVFRRKSQLGNKCLSLRLQRFTDTDFCMKTL